MKYFSILRGAEYNALKKITLNGSILDVGGSRKSGYHSLIKGENTFTVINLDSSCEPDHFVDVEKTFPFDSDTFDNAICLNVLEHIYNFENAFSEQVRCVKPGGKIVIATPFMHHVHASPDDYHRYTDSSYKKMAAKFDCDVVEITPLGHGLFSLWFQTVGGSIPTTLLQSIAKKICVNTDAFFNKISNKYRTLTSRIPLGYFVVLKKR